MQGNNSNGSRALWGREFAALWATLVLVLAFSAEPSEAAPFAYVTNTFSGTVSQIDTATNMVVATFPAGGSPEQVAVSPDGKHLYVTIQGAVSVIDTATNMVMTTVPVGNFPLGVAVTPDGTHVYVANSGSAFPGTVSVINTATNTPGPTITVGNGPQEVVVTPDGTHAYVANGGEATASVINTATNTVVATVHSGGGGPVGIAVTPDGKHVFLASAASGTVTVIDTVTNTPGPTITVGPPVPGSPFEIGVNPDGKHAYVTTNSGSPVTVAVIDTATNAVVAQVPVAGATILGGIAVTPDGKHVYVVHFGSFPGTVSVIDTATDTVATTVTVGTKPIGVAIITDIPFSAFTAELAIVFGTIPNQDGFGLLSSFTLGSAGDGIDPVAEPVTLQIGSYATTIPVGSFTKSPSETYSFIGTINGVSLEVVIQPTATNKRFALEAAALGANLTGTKNPVTVRLSIGNKSGTALVNAVIF